MVGTVNPAYPVRKSGAHHWGDTDRRETRAVRYIVSWREDLATDLLPHPFCSG